VPPDGLRRALSDGALSIGAHRPAAEPPQRHRRRPSVGPQAIPRRRITSRALRPPDAAEAPKGSSQTRREERRPAPLDLNMMRVCGGGSLDAEGRGNDDEDESDDGSDEGEDTECAFEEFVDDALRTGLTPPAEARVPRFNRQPVTPPGTPRCWLCGAYHAGSGAGIDGSDLLTLFVNAPIYYEVALVRSPRDEHGPLRRQASERHARAHDTTRQQLYDAFLTQCVLSPSVVDRAKVQGAPDGRAPSYGTARESDGEGCGCALLDAYESMLAHLHANWHAMPREARIFVVSRTKWYTLQCNARDVHELLSDRNAEENVELVRGQLKFLYSERLRLVRELMLQLVKGRLFVHYKCA
jgi:hypothetical protein